MPFPKAGYNLNAGGSSLYGSLSAHDHSESSFALRPSAGAVDRNNSPILDPTAGMLGSSSITSTSNNNCEFSSNACSANAKFSHHLNSNMHVDVTTYMYVERGANIFV